MTVNREMTMHDNEQKSVFRFDLGRTDYKQAWDIQKKLVSLRSENKLPDCLLFTEHKPVITMGRATLPKNLLCSEEYLRERGIDLYEIERGGDITFHGPGQLILYPIIDLNGRGRDLHQYLRELEALVIATLSDLGLQAETKNGLTGAWIKDQKLAAIGVAVSRWVTYHGLALNVNTNLDYFKLINPCGITKYPVGSVAQLLGKEIEMATIADIMAEKFGKIFGRKVDKIDDWETILSEIAVV